MHVGHLIVLPTPAFLELLEDECDPPASFLVDFGEDLQDLFLFSSIRETLGGVSKRAKGDRCDTTTKNVSISVIHGLILEYVPILDMSSNATDHLRVLLLHVPHVWIVGWHVRVNLGEEEHDGVVEESGDDG